MAYIGSNPKSKTYQFIPQSTIPTSPRIGDVYRDDGTNKAAGLYQYNGTSWEAVGAGSGSGINYILNGDASQGITGWATYADAAASSPVDGTGGSPTVTWTVNTSTPLRGAADFILTKDAADRQGEGASYDFTIANADITTPCQVKFSYKASTNFSFANGDVQVFVYDVTNAALISVIPQTLDGSGHFKGEFQSTTSTSYRLILHVATTNATAFTLQVDDVQVGPSTLAYGFLPDKQYNISSYVSTNTSFVNVRSVAIPYKTRDGAWRLRFNIKGTQTSATTTTITVTGVTFKSGTSNYQPVSVIPSDSGRGFTIPGTSTLQVNTTTSYTEIGASGDVELDSMPTWAVDSAPVQIGDGAETRVVAAKYTVGGGAAVSTSAPFQCTTKEYDTHNAVTTGTNWRFTAPVSGIYKIYGVVVTTSGTPVIKLYKNGVANTDMGQLSSATYSQCFTGSISLSAGDYIDVRPDSSLTQTTYTTNYIAIERISGPSSVAASEKVYAKYNIAGAVSSDSSTPVNFATKTVDSHAAVTTGSGWKFTAPVSGFYQISASLATSSATSNINIYKNGSANDYIGYVFTSNVNCITGGIYLNAGDYIDIRSATSITTATSTAQSINIIKI